MFRKSTLLTLLTPLVFLFYVEVIAREDRNYETAPDAGTKLHSAVEAPPRFPGGMTDFFRYIRAHTPLNGNVGKAEISFFINKDGTVDLPAISSEPSNSNKFALLATLAKGPKWMPGIQNGRPMRVGYILAVNFDTINQVPVIIVDYIHVIKEEMIVAFEKVEENGDIYIRGTVTKINGEPLVSVNISSPGPPDIQFANTDTTGKFSMALPASKIINFSCVGHVTKKLYF